MDVERARTSENEKKTISLGCWEARIRLRKGLINELELGHTNDNVQNRRPHDFFSDVRHEVRRGHGLAHGGRGKEERAAAQ